MAEEEGELVVDTALPVVQVGMADAAGLDRDDRLARAGVRDDDGLERHRRPLGRRHHTAHFLSHVGSSRREPS